MKPSPTIKKSNWGRAFIYPKKPSGQWYSYRKYVSYLLLVCLFAFPFLKFNGEQLLLLNFLERKFVFFGVIFTPQDFHLFALAMLIFMVFIVCFTIVFGRIWCGWACPQTIFMEMVFRRIEYWIEGDAQQQQKLDAQEWTGEKVLKKATKHGIFLIVSFSIANTFLAYIIGSDLLFQIVIEPIGEHVSGLLAICIFTLLFYGVFAYVREVVCTVICPYGRLQGVLLDSQSLIVAYDEKRGEPRGRINRGAHRDKGDCVDCGICVQVCPTGIDIRQGTQLECISCMACIDSCNAVMAKINKPPSLIGVFNQEKIKHDKPYKIGPKVYGYAAVLAVAIVVLCGLVYKREVVETTVLRASGTLYQLRGDSISNLYHAELTNKTNKDIKFSFRTKDQRQKIEFIQQPNILRKESSAELTFFLVRKQKDIAHYKTEVAFEVLEGTQLISETSTTFFSRP